jgi:hypothetical protein
MVKPRTIIIFCFIAASLAFALMAGFSQSIEVLKRQNRSLDCRSLNPKLQLLVGTPNCSSTRDKGDGPASFSLNQYGFRGPQWDPKPKPGVVRVLLLGGSDTFAPGVDDPHSFGPQVERALRRLGHPNIEVLNLSIEGATTIHHAIQLQDYLDLFSPDLVFLMTMDDSKLLRDAVFHRYAKFGLKDKVIGIQSGKEQWGDTVHRVVSMSPLLLQYARSSLESFRTFSAASDMDTATWDNPWLKPVLNTIVWMSRTTKKANARFVVLNRPRKDRAFRQQREFDVSWMLQVFSRLTPSPTFDTKTMINTLKNQNVLLRKPEGFPTTLTHPILFFPQQRYLNEKGVRAAAGAIATTLSETLL